MGFPAWLTLPFWCAAFNLFVSTTAAEQAVFTYDSNAGPQFTYALNAVRNGDLYFHMSGPSQYSWMAVGIGEDMDDNLMFIAYPSGGDDAVVLSPRVAFDGKSEPSYYPQVRCETMNASYERKKGAATGTMSIDAVCHNATTWQGGSLDLSSSSQEFMFAFGPDRYLPSESMEAPLLRHQKYGNFEMDMTKATSTGSGAVPDPNGPGASYVRASASNADDVKSDGDYLGIIHGVVACAAYIGLFPLGALLLRLSKKIPVRLHYICQSVAFVVVLVGFGLAIAASREYNRSRDYTDPHQIIGLVLLAAVVIQFVGGAVHHMIYKKKGKSTVLGKVHLFLGLSIVLLAMINGGLGLNLAIATTGSIIAYSVVIGVFGLSLVATRMWIGRRVSRTVGNEKFREEFSSGDDVPLNERGRDRTSV